MEAIDTYTNTQNTQTIFEWKEALSLWKGENRTSCLIRMDEFNWKKKSTYPRVSKKLSVSLFVCYKLDPNYLSTSRTEWAEIILGYLRQKDMSQKFLLSEKWLAGPQLKGLKSNILAKYLSCLTWDQAEISKIAFDKLFATLTARAVFGTPFFFKRTANLWLFGWKWLTWLAPFAGVWNLPHKFHIYGIFIYSLI